MSMPLPFPFHLRSVVPFAIDLVRGAIFPIFEFRPLFAVVVELGGFFTLLVVRAEEFGVEEIEAGGEEGEACEAADDAAGDGAGGGFVRGVGRGGGAGGGGGGGEGGDGDDGLGLAVGGPVALGDGEGAALVVCAYVSVFCIAGR